MCSFNCHFSGGAALGLCHYSAMIVDFTELSDFLFPCDYAKMTAYLNCWLFVLLCSVMSLDINCYLGWSKSLNPFVEVCSGHRRTLFSNLFLWLSDKLLACLLCSMLVSWSHKLQLNCLSSLQTSIVSQSTLRLEIPHTLLQVVSLDRALKLCVLITYIAYRARPLYYCSGGVDQASGSLPSGWHISTNRAWG